MAGRWGCQRAIAIAAAVVLASLAWAPHTAVALRGVNPAQLSKYSAAQASGAFECFDGSKRIVSSAVNDNYCDCTDGSDEPGTSACTAGTFYCRNRGHLPLTINSSFVDDNICDCCDGSDEVPGVCKNTCVEKGAAAREALRTAAKEAGAGNKIRRQRIRDAAGKKAQWRDKIEALKKEEVALQPQVDRLNKAKQAAEDKQSAARERKQKADDARAEAEEKRRQAELKKAQAAVAQEDQDQQAADEASKLAQPLSQRLRQQSGDAEEEQAAEEAGSAAAAGSEQQGVSPEQAAAGQGVSIDTSADALQKANEAMQKALGRTAEEIMADAEAKKAASAQAAAAADGDADPNAGARTAELAAGASGQVHVDSDPDALAKANLQMQEALLKQGKSLDDLKAAAADKADESPEQKQKTDEELAQERMSQWVKSDNAAPAAADDGAAAEEEVEEAEAEQPEAGGEEPTAEEEVEDDEEEAAEEEALEQDAAAASQQPTLTLKPGLGGPVAKGINWLMGFFTKKPVETAELERLEAAATKARDAWSAKSDRLTEAQKESRELEEQLQRDYGPDDAFLALEGQCFTATAEKYTYEVCPFGSAAQKEGGSSTSLGSFQRFEDDYRAMAFQSGAACWSGPARSIRVQLECGAKESLSAISEPSRCVYAAKLATPSLCTKALQDQWQAEADAAQAELDSIGKDEL